MEQSGIKPALRWTPSQGLLDFPFLQNVKKNHGTSSFYGTSLLLHIHEEGRYGRYRAETNPPPLPPPPLVVVVVLLSWSEVSVQGGCMYTVYCITILPLIKTGFNPLNSPNTRDTVTGWPPGDKVRAGTFFKSFFSKKYFKNEERMARQNTIPLWNTIYVGQCAVFFRNYF